MLLNLGFKVTGSDMNLSDNVTRIRKLGIDVELVTTHPMLAMQMF
ncbi:MAG: hypothetical protein Ct9H300mP29_3920 [Candidatus Neomarinimicrobiota bacterium]|nr:MAG: hypothetical protein Ct9H300mP29_3920 [Candidatus Neomarinimicrobiota bacterium]